MSDKNRYWANAPKDEIGSEIVSRCDEYFKYMESSGVFRKLRDVYDMYFGGSAASFNQSSSDVSSGGEQGELTLVRVNHYRNLVQHMLVLATTNRPALECRAANMDMRSKAQTILGNGLLDYYMRDKRVERHSRFAKELSLVLGEGFVDMAWDTWAGEFYATDPDTNQPVYEGDIKFSTPLGPFEVVRDVRAQEYNRTDWRIVIEWVNRFDLAAMYPDMEEQILAVSASLMDSHFHNLGGLNHLMSEPGSLIPLRKLYHRRTPAVSGGRLVLCLSADCVLFDGPMPYMNLPGGMPLYRVAPSEFFGTPFGYTPSWDIVGLSKLYDSLVSSIATNQVNYAVQNILVAKGHDLTYTQLSGGANLLEYDPQAGPPPVGLNLTSTPQEVFTFVDKLESTEQLLVGVNDVIRGLPQDSLRSGSALALVASQAIQFSSGFQSSCTALDEDIGLGTIKMLQTFAKTKRVASIAGKSQRYMLAEFSGDDISEINRVLVDVTNPLSRTVAGRVEMAKDLLSIPGAVSSPDQYIGVLETGNYRPILQAKEAELLTIDLENEQLQSGVQPRALITDNHVLHIQEHKGVVSMPDNRDPNSPSAIATLQHIMEHINLMSTADPRVLLATGQQPMPPPMPPPGGPEGGNPENPPPGPQNPVPDVQQQASEVRQPQLPKNPLTGERFDPQAPPSAPPIS